MDEAEVEEVPFELLDSHYGYYSVADFTEWVLLSPGKGNVIECTLPIEFADKPDITAAFLVINKTLGDSGDFQLEVRSLGCTDPDLTSYLSSQFNRKRNFVHVCGGEHCDVDGPELFHLKGLALWDGETFSAPYLNASAKKMLRSYREIGIAAPEGDGGREPGGKATPGTGRTPRTPTRKVVKEPSREVEQAGRGKKEDASGKGKKEDPGGKDYAHLRERLSAVKRRRAEVTDVERVEALDGEPLEDGDPLEPDPTFAAVPALTMGRRLEDTAQDLGSMTLRGQGQQGHPPGGGRREGQAKEEKEKGKLGVGALLARTAAVATSSHQPPGGGGETPNPWTVALAGTSGSKKKKKKKKRSKKKKKKKSKKKVAPGGGSPGGSSGSSSSSGESEDEGESSSGDSSGSSRYLPPLRRESSGKPGSVLQLLIRTVEDHLAAIGETSHPGERYQQRWSRALLAVHLFGPAPSWQAGGAWRWIGSEVSCLASGKHRRGMGLREEFGDPYSRAAIGSRSSGDHRSEAPLEDAGP